MSCSQIQADLSLYLYGELDFAAEEFMETHLAGCPFCQLALNREKEWHASVNKQQHDIRPEFLGACRENLLNQIANEPTSAAHARHRISAWWQGLLDIRATERSYRLAAASFLVLLGFGAGRVFHSSGLEQPGNSGLDTAGFVQPEQRQVRGVVPQPDGRVRLILQQVQVGELSGNRSDDAIRALLVAAARQSLDPGVRLDSVEMLAGQSGEEIRNALVNSIRNDTNAAVRVKAIESLRQFPGDAMTRDVLEFALAHDRDPGVRAEAMDVLVPAQGQVQITPQLLGIMTDVMHSAQADEYVKWRCAQILNRPSLPNDAY
jgi:hypothetical protein